MAVTGSGPPTTVFAPGLAAATAELRPFAGGVPGTRVFCSFADDLGWAYPRLAAELRAAADHAGATRALGVSLGAGALLRVLAASPDRFDRVVLVLPASLDPHCPGNSERLRRMAPLAAAGRVDELTALLLAEQPVTARDRREARWWARQQARRLCGPALLRALRELPGQVPLPDRRQLASCTSRALVVGQPDDPAHPGEIARAVAAALPRAQLELLPPGGLFWAHRARVRALVAGFLGADTGRKGRR